MERVQRAFNAPKSRGKGSERTNILEDIIGGGASAHIARARQNFWTYCQYINPKFFRNDRPHLRELADALQALYERRLINPATGEAYRKMMINIGPRFGKSYTLCLFEQWVYGRNQMERIISTSYNEILSGRFARNVRDGIDATKADPKVHIFADVFPGVKIKYGDAATQMWSLEGQYFSFLAAGFGGTITGVGCSIGVIDDPVKNHMEAANESVLEGQWAWYTDTFLSRIEENGLQIIVMTRWATGDLCGRLLEAESAEWYVMRMPAVVDEERREMLCPALLSWARWEKIKSLTSEAIVRANYLQEPIDVQGRLYTELMLYEDVPRKPNGDADFERIISYTDTADAGDDNLCSWAAGLRAGELWVLDAYYTDEGMEITEPGTADFLHRNHVNIAAIESNNGGRGFARNVSGQLWKRHKDRSVYILPRNQRQNKEARILVNSTYVMQHVFFPKDFARKHPRLHRDLTNYQRKGKNAHDDAPDSLTGLAEIAQGKITTRTRRANGKGART